MHSFPAGAARGQLGAAGEPVRQHHRVRVGRTRRGPQPALGAGRGHVIVPAFEAEVPGQPAAPGVEDLDVDTAAAQDGY